MQSALNELPEIPALVADGVITDPDSAKGRLLNASATLFKQKGFARTTVRDIAAEVGILSGSIFHHFPNKESILLAVMSEAIYLALARMRNAIEGEASIPKRFRALVRCELEAIHGFTGVGFTLLSSEWRYLSEASQKEVLKLRDEYEAFHRGVYAEAKEQGLIKVEPFFLRHFLRGALAETANWFHLDGDYSLDELVEQVSLTAALPS
ncbi:MAG: TetR/AcrR family transcriptional regulator [Cellvibrionaceae bacterium]|nr:TetR/AcrR family transcriptional regulator [Cellvibrionaceae bacterium]